MDIDQIRWRVQLWCPASAAEAAAVAAAIMGLPRTNPHKDSAVFIKALHSIP
jgi:hypothetical protein